MYIIIKYENRENEFFVLVNYFLLKNFKIIELIFENFEIFFLNLFLFIYIYIISLLLSSSFLTNKNLIKGIFYYKKYIKSFTYY
jgi:hypothetical protein